MATDKLKWHARADDFPADLSPRNGATHMGMFLDWAVARGLTADRLHVLSPIGEWLLRRRVISGRTFLLWFSDGVFSSIELLNETGQRFADSCYNQFVMDFNLLFGGEYKTPYHTPYNRNNLQRVFTVLDKRFREWRRDNLP